MKLYIVTAAIIVLGAGAATAQVRTTCQQFPGGLTRCNSAPSGGLDFGLLGPGFNAGSAINAFEAGRADRGRREAAEAQARILAQQQEILEAQRRQVQPEPASSALSPAEMADVERRWGPQALLARAAKGECHPARAVMGIYGPDFAAVVSKLCDVP